MEAVRVKAKMGFAIVHAAARQSNVSIEVAHRITRHRTSVDPGKPGSGHVDLTPKAAIRLANAILVSVANALPEGQVLVRDLSKRGEPFTIIDLNEK